MQVGGAGGEGAGRPRTCRKELPKCFFPSHHLERVGGGVALLHNVIRTDRVPIFVYSLTNSHQQNTSMRHDLCYILRLGDKPGRDSWSREAHTHSTNTYTPNTLCDSQPGRRLCRQLAFPAAAPKLLSGGSGSVPCGGGREAPPPSKNLQLRSEDPTPCEGRGRQAEE